MARAQERVYAGMRARVRNLDIEPGSRLNVADIADEYDASTIPVREALARLAAEGLIEREPQAGFLAPRVSLRRVIDDNTVVFLFLRHVTDLYFEERPDGFVAALDEANERLAAAAHSPSALATEVEEATAELLGLVQSPKLASAVRAALDSSHYYRTVYFRLFPAADYIAARRLYAQAMRDDDDRTARLLVRQMQQRFSEGSREVCREVTLSLVERF